MHDGKNISRLIIVFFNGSARDMRDESFLIYFASNRTVDDTSELHMTAYRDISNSSMNYNSLI
jgi:hypothetical protein